MTEITISEFHIRYYIQSIKKLAFHLPHVRILGTNHCGEMRGISFKGRGLFQDVMCRRKYADRVVASFANQIKSE